MWVVIFAVLIAFFCMAEFDAAVDASTTSASSSGGLQLHLIMAVGGIVLAIVLALLGALGRISRNPVAVRRRRLLHLVLPRARR